MRGRMAVTVAALVASGAAHAQTGVPGALSVEAAATLTSDYRFRGLSLSDGDPALQGSVTLGHRSGLYAGAWASSVGGGATGGADAEVDLYAGLRRSLAGANIDAGVLYYVFPGGRPSSAEPYASAALTLGPLTAKLGGNYAWRQRALALADGRARSGFYGYGELSAGVPATPLTVSAHLGRSFDATRATFGERYNDWRLQLAYVRAPFTLSAAYVDTSRTVLDERGRGIGGAGFVGQATIAF